MTDISSASLDGGGEGTEHCGCRRQHHRGTGRLTVEFGRLVIVKSSFILDRIPAQGSMPLLTSGIVLGIGLGGFVDGIVLHQIAQWHNMGSAVLPPISMDAMSRNMVWDGQFHAATLTITLIGVYMLRADSQHEGRPCGATSFTGQLVFGWGAFNLIEGGIDHHLLNLHHVRDIPAHIPLYDWVFLAVGGIGVMACGWLLMRRDASTHGDR